MTKPINAGRNELHLIWHTKPVGNGMRVEYCVCGCRTKRLVTSGGFVIHVNGDRLKSIMR